MKIAIVSIATNNYKKFLKTLVESIKKHFIPSVQKDFYLFTDAHLEWFDKSITHFEIEHEPWPFITLKRYQFILKAIDCLKKYDYVFYFDCDMEFVDTLSNFDDELKKYYAVRHPAVMIDSKFWTVETNPKSTAYISERYNCEYVQGCIWGARGDSIEYMVENIKNNIDIDTKNNIIAVWHDESHLNKFMVDHRNESSILSPSMAYPEHWQLPVNKVVIHKDKNMEEYPRFSGGSIK